jgi:hypothetical protein
MTTLATCPGLAVPLWAQDGSATAIISAHVNAVIISAAATFSTRVALSGTVPPEAPQIISGNASSTAESAGLFVAGTFTIPASTSSLAPVLQAQRTAGSGALRAGSTGANGLILWSAQITR